jgi:hypothetical protein
VKKKIKAIRHADVGPGKYWMFDSDPEYQHEDPSSVTIVEKDGCTYVIGANAGLDDSDIAHIDDIVDTVVFVPIVPPKYSELEF